eukprot:g6839.t1
MEPDGLEPGGGVLVANPAVELPRESKASKWDEPIRCPKDGKPYFIVAHLAPNYSSYCYWLTDSVPRGLEKKGIDIGGSVPTHVRRIDMIHLVLWCMLCKPAIWVHKIGNCAFRHIIAGLSVENFQQCAKELEAWAQKRLGKTFATCSSTVWRCHAYGVTRYMEFAIIGRCMLDTWSKAQQLLADAARLSVGSSSGHVCFLNDYSTLRAHHTYGSLMFFADVIKSTATAGLEYFDLRMMPLPLQHGSAKKYISDAPSSDAEEELVGELLQPNIKKDRELAAAAAFAGDDPGSKKDQAGGRGRGGKKKAAAKEKNEAAASAYSAAGFVFGCESYLGPRFLSDRFVPLGTPIRATPIQHLIADTDNAANGMSDQGSSECRCGQLLPNVLPMVWEFGRAHRLSNNVKSLSKPLHKAATLFNSFLRAPKGSKGNKTELSKEIADLVKVVSTKPRAHWAKFPHILEIQAETGAQSVKEGLETPLEIIAATESRWLRDFLFGKGWMRNGAMVKCATNRMHTRSCDVPLVPPERESAILEYDGNPATKPTGWLGYPGEMYCVGAPLTLEDCREYCDVAKSHWDVCDLLELISKTPSERPLCQDPATGTPDEDALRKMRLYLDPEATPEKKCTTLDINKLWQERRALVWKTMMHETGSAMGLSANRLRMATVLFQRVVNIGLFEQWDPSYGVWIEYGIHNNEELTISEAGMDRVEKHYSRELPVNFKQFCRCILDLGDPRAREIVNCRTTILPAELDAITSRAVSYGHTHSDLRAILKQTAEKRMHNRRKEAVLKELCHELKQQQQKVYNHCKHTTRKHQKSQAVRDVVEYCGRAPSTLRPEDLGFRAVEMLSLLHEVEKDGDGLTPEAVECRHTTSKGMMVERQLHRRLQLDPCTRIFVKCRRTGVVIRVTNFRGPFFQGFRGGSVSYYYLYDGRLDVKFGQIHFAEQVSFLDDRWIDPDDFLRRHFMEYSTSAQLGAIHLLMGCIPASQSCDAILRAAPPVIRYRLYLGLTMKPRTREQRVALLTAFRVQWNSAKIPAARWAGCSIQEQDEDASGLAFFAACAKAADNVKPKAPDMLAAEDKKNTDVQGGEHQKGLQRQTPQFVFRLHQLASECVGSKKQTTTTVKRVAKPVVEFRSYRVEQGEGQRCRIEWLNHYRPRIVRMCPTCELVGADPSSLVMSSLLPYTLVEFGLLNPADCVLTDESNKQSLPIPPEVFASAQECRLLAEEQNLLADEDADASFFDLQQGRDENATFSDSDPDDEANIGDEDDLAGDDDEELGSAHAALAADKNVSRAGAAHKVDGGLMLPPPVVGSSSSSAACRPASNKLFGSTAAAGSTTTNTAGTNKRQLGAGVPPAAGRKESRIKPNSAAAVLRKPRGTKKNESAAEPALKKRAAASSSRNGAAAAPLPARPLLMNGSGGSTGVRRAPCDDGYKMISDPFGGEDGDAFVSDANFFIDSNQLQKHQESAFQEEEDELQDDFDYPRQRRRRACGPAAEEMEVERELVDSGVGEQLQQVEDKNSLSFFKPSATAGQRLGSGILRGSRRRRSTSGVEEAPTFIRGQAVPVDEDIVFGAAAAPARAGKNTKMKARAGGPPAAAATGGTKMKNKMASAPTVKKATSKRDAICAIVKNGFKLKKKPEAGKGSAGNRAAPAASSSSKMKK